MSKRHIVILVVMLVTLPVLYYLISPIWRVKELDENLPGQSGPVIKDNLFNMDEKTTADFNKAMLEMAPKAMMMNPSQRNLSRISFMISNSCASESLFFMLFILGHRDE